MKRHALSLKISILFCFSLLSLLFTGCQPEKPEAASESLPDNTTGSTMVNQIVRKLGNDLIAEGYTADQASRIQQAALNRISTEGHSGSSDISAVAPAALRGAQLSVSNSGAGFTTTRAKTDVIAVIIKSIMSSLSGRVAAQVSPQGKAVRPSNSSRQLFATLNDAYKSIIDQLVTSSIELLDESGIPSSEVGDAMGAVVNTFIASFSVAGVPGSSEVEITQVVVVKAVASIDETGVASAEYSTVISKTIKGSIAGLKNLGKSGSDISDVADEIAAAAIKGLDGISSVSGLNASTYVSSIKTAVTDGLTEVNITVTGTITTAIDSAVVVAMTDTFTTPSVWGQGKWGASIWKSKS